MACALIHPRRDEPDRPRRHPEPGRGGEATSDEAVQPREGGLARLAKGGRGVGEDPAPRGIEQRPP